MNKLRVFRTRLQIAVLCCGVLLASACGSANSEQTSEPAPAPVVATTAPIEVLPESETESEPEPEAELEPDPTSAAEPDPTSAAQPTAPAAAAQPDPTSTVAPAASVETSEQVEAVDPVTGCAAIAQLFVTRGSANADLDDPAVAAVCTGSDLVITSNAIPDYTYIGTSPGVPRAQDWTFTIPAVPTFAAATTDVPVVGIAAVTLGGIPIFGPTEGAGGDVDSMPGILSECGSHNGPSGFHIHKIMTSANTDCLFSPEQVASGPQLVGYALDGFPIYTGDGRYTSSWELTDESLFATDTWAAHSFVEGSGDLDQCNGLTAADGSYAYYTTDTFPYVLGCYAGVVDIVGSGGGGGGDRPEPAEGDEPTDRPERAEGEEGGDRPEQTEGATEGDRPERPEGGETGERPERPEGAEGGERPERPGGDAGAERP